MKAKLTYLSLVLSVLLFAGCALVQQYPTSVAE